MTNLKLIVGGKNCVSDLENKLLDTIKSSPYLRGELYCYFKKSFKVPSKGPFLKNGIIYFPLGRWPGSDPAAL